jgi:hypothetical protein
MAAALALMFIGGCGDNDEENPPPSTPPGAAGIYYGIANLGGGEGLETEHRVKLLIEQGSAVATGGNSPLQSLGIASDPLTGYISYGDSTYIVTGTTQNDSLGIIWTTSMGTWTLFGVFDEQSIQGFAAGPIGTDTLVLYRWTGSTRNIADRWSGHYSNGSCWPYGGTLRAHFSQSDTLITGTLVVSGAYEMGDTLTIYEGSFFDPILELTAIDSDITPPSKLHLMGTLASADSMTGTYDWWWDRCLDEGIWDLKRMESDTEVAFASIFAVAYHLEEATGTMGLFFAGWVIDDVGISGATISVDGIPLTDHGDGYYSLQTTVAPGADYVFDIFHPDYGSTTGIAKVPGQFMVTSPVQGAVIPRGQDLVVTFTSASEATFYDAWLSNNNAHGVALAPATSLTLPGTQIQQSVADVLELEAINGDYVLWSQTFTGFFGINAKEINVTVQ